MNKKKLTFEEFQIVVSNLLGIEKSEIKKESIIYQDIGIDSLGLVNLGTKIQKIYKISISAASMIEVLTIGEFYNAIKTLVEEKTEIG